MAATWTTIPDGDVDPESPITTALMQALRDNPEGIAGRVGGAPLMEKVESIQEQNGVELNLSVVDIGDWDMNAAVQHPVAHGLTQAKIRQVTFILRNDINTVYTTLPGVPSASTGHMQSWIVDIESTNVRLERLTGGDFDNASYETPPDSNRGWIVILHTV